MYVVPKSKKSIKQDQFEITIPTEVKGKSEDRTFSLPSMKFLKPAVMAQAEQMGQISASRHMLESVAPGLFDLFEDADQINGFMEAWQEFSGITVGESAASSGS
jgi:hypothetical protein